MVLAAQYRVSRLLEGAAELLQSVDFQHGAGDIARARLPERPREARQRIGLRIRTGCRAQGGCAGPVCPLERIARRHGGERRVVDDRGRTIAALRRLQGFRNEGRRLSVLRELQVGVGREVRRVVVVRLNLERREIRPNGVLPKADHRVDVRGHVTGVRDGRSDLGVAPGRRDALVGEGREVVRVNQVVRDTRVLRVLRVQPFEDPGRLQLAGICHVVLRRSSLECQRVEDLRLEVVRVPRGQRLQRVRVALEPRRDGNGLVISKVHPRGLDPVALTRAAGVHRTRLLERIPGGPCVCRRGRRDQRVPEQIQGDAPVADRAGRIPVEHATERLAGVVEPIGVQHRHTALEFGLHGRTARRREVDPSELMLTGLMALRSGEGGRQDEGGDQYRLTFH